MELLTVKDVARRLKVCVRQVWKLNASGQLPESVRVARSVRWRAVDLAEWIEMGCPSRERFEADRDARGER